MAIKKYFYELMTDSRKGLLDQAMSGVLWILSLGYALIVWCTRILYRIHILSVYRSPKPVISVGNITMGGVGKTPLVICLVEILKERKIKTVVLSRGYGARDGQNDEVLMFHEVLPDVPIMTGGNRKNSIQKALAVNPVDIFIADDAFSHWPLYRDLDIVAIDSSNPFGNGQLIPRGTLREEVAALRRADIFVLTKIEENPGTADLHRRIHEIKPGALIVESKHQPENFQNIFTGTLYSLDTFQSKKVIAFCAIGKPKSFELSLQVLGLSIERHVSFADHHAYTPEDIKKLVEIARAENVNILMTTHKDAVKISALQNLFQDMIVLQLNIKLEITLGKEQLVERILSLQSH